MGHALRKALGVIARRAGWGPGAATAAGVAELAAQAGAPVLAGSSLKAALDLDWDHPAARETALGVVLAALDAVEALAADLPAPPAPRTASMPMPVPMRSPPASRSPAGSATRT